MKGTGHKRAASESADVPDDRYVDGMVANAAIEALKELSTRQPFFLAVGFRKPHLPFAAPKKYWDLYDRDAIPLPEQSRHPGGAPELATRSWKELEGYTDIPADGVLSTVKVRELRHGYYACVSYLDALIGRLLEQLAAQKLLKNTVIVFFGDHGFHLGEQGVWTKANNFELSTRVPLIVSVPGQATAGRKTEAIVELLDLYPTLVDLCGLPKADGVEGVTLKPLLDASAREWNRVAFSQFPRARKGNRYRKHGDIMGYAVRTGRFRYVEWRDWKSQRVLARELYDHRADPAEMLNVASHPNHTETIGDLSRRLKSQNSH